MARSLTAGVTTALADGVLRPILIAAVETNSGTVRVWTGIGDLVWDGNTYLGVGSLGGVSNIEESGELKATSITFSLSGIASEYISLVLGDLRQGLTASLWLGLIDSSNAVISDPVLLFEGLTDVGRIDDGPDSAQVSITAESRLVTLQRTRARYYTDADQQRDSAGDLGFEFVPALQDAQIVWKSAADGVQHGLIYQTVRRTM